MNKLSLAQIVNIPLATPIRNLLILLLLFLPAQAQTSKRELRVPTKEPVKAIPVSAKRWALVVGVDQYNDSQIAKLDGASNDATMLANALIDYAGFPKDQVLLLTSAQPIDSQPSRGNILRRLANLDGIVPEDGLLLFAFAGHGIERGGRAYLLPSDAQVSSNITLLEETALNVEVIKNWIRQTRVEQVLIILDACRNDPMSGRGNGDNLLTEAYIRGFNFDTLNQEVKAFATLYAAEVGHRAFEYKQKQQGYFSWALVEGIKGKAANEKGEVTLARLKSFLEEEVPKRSLIDLGKDKVQRPFAIIEGYKAEELIISVINLSIPEKAPAVTQEVPKRLNNIEYWDSIISSFESIGVGLKPGVDYTQFGRELSNVRQVGEQAIQKYSFSENTVETRLTALISGMITDYTWSRTIWTLKFGRSSQGTVSESDSPIINAVFAQYPDLRSASVRDDKYSVDKIVGGLWKKAAEKVARARFILSEAR
jgi:hypothetical protein